MRPSYRTTTIALMLLVPITQSRLVKSMAAEPTRVDIEYAKLGDRSLKLDLYFPKRDTTSSQSPLVVWVHGGAWRSGSKENVPLLRWLDHGFAIASVEYRLSPEAKFPAQVHDIKAAIRFLRARSDELGLDPERFVIAGGSAGGHLAALVGVSSGIAPLEGTTGEQVDTASDAASDAASQAPSYVSAIVSFYGASDLQTILQQSTEYGLSVRVPALQLFLGGQPSELPAVAKLASPVTHVDPTDPPLWLIHGDADPQMPVQQSRQLADLYRQTGLPVDFEVIPGGRHGGEAFFAAERLDRIAKGLLEAIATPQTVR
jgi:acetyl esterase/lipase